MIRRNNPIAYALDFFTCLTVWTTLIVAPVVSVFPAMRHATRQLDLAIDIVWCFLILFNFARHDESSDFKQIAKDYAFSRSGSFWVDLIATVPPLICLEKRPSLDWCHLLRLYHL